MGFLINKFTCNQPNYQKNPPWCDELQTLNQCYLAKGPHSHRGISTPCTEPWQGHFTDVRRLAQTSPVRNILAHLEFNFGFAENDRNVKSSRKHFWKDNLRVIILSWSFYINIIIICFESFLRKLSAFITYS